MLSSAWFEHGGAGEADELLVIMSIAWRIDWHGSETMASWCFQSVDLRKIRDCWFRSTRVYWLNTDKRCEFSYNRAAQRVFRAVLESFSQCYGLFHSGTVFSTAERTMEYNCTFYTAILWNNSIETDWSLIYRKRFYYSCLLDTAFPAGIVVALRLESHSCDVSSALLSQKLISPLFIC